MCAYDITLIHVSKIYKSFVWNMCPKAQTWASVKKTLQYTVKSFKFMGIKFRALRMMDMSIDTWI